MADNGVFASADRIVSRIITALGIAFLGGVLQADTFTVIVPDPAEDWRSSYDWTTALSVAIVEHQAARHTSGTTIVLDTRTTVNPEWFDGMMKTSNIVHLIGHGAGGTVKVGLLTAMAALQPRTIDHLTILDCPAPIAIPKNVLFADNYFQTNASGGIALAGAYNRRLFFEHGDAGAQLLAWYESTTLMGADSGYFFTDCIYGQRPFQGYRSRRAGAPTIRFVYDAAQGRMSKRFAAGTTGKYFWQVSSDLHSWTTTNDSLIFDGHSFNYVEPASSGDPSQFFRLVSNAESF